MNPCIFTTSWDDGHPLDLRLAELLALFGISGTFYIPFESEWGKLDPIMVRSLSGSFEIGAHTLHHLPLTRLSDKDAFREIAEPKDRLEQITGKACVSFCFPQGKFNPKHVRMAAQAGYDNLRTVELLNSGSIPRQGRLRIMGTTIQAYPHDPLAYARNIVKRFSFQNIPNLGAVIGKDWRAAAVTLVQKTAQSGGAFHLWGHSWEIEQIHFWKELENFFLEVCSTNFGFSYLSNAEACNYGSSRVR